MDASTVSVIRLLKCSGMLIAATAFAVPAFAQVYKCKGSNGSPVFQEAPCDDAATGIKVPDRAPDKAASQKAAADATKKSMNEAFQSRMNKRDYQGALAFATTDKQKSQAQQKLAEKESKCRGLGIKLQEAQAKFDKSGNSAKSALDQAKNNYRDCV